MSETDQPPQEQEAINRVHATVTLPEESWKALEEAIENQKLIESTKRKLEEAKAELETAIARFQSKATEAGRDFLRTTDTFKDCYFDFAAELSSQPNIEGLNETMTHLREFGIMEEDGTYNFLDHLIVVPAQLESVDFPRLDGLSELRLASYDLGTGRVRFVDVLYPDDDPEAEEPEFNVSLELELGNREPQEVVCEVAETAK